MCENNIVRTKVKFLTAWSILNIAGWFAGIFFVSLVELGLEYYYKFSASRTFFIWFPLGASIGLFQWFKLRQFGVKLLLWLFINALGFSTLFTLYFWVQNFDTFDYWEYNIPVWMIISGLAATTLVGGTIIGYLQSTIIRKHIFGLGLWIRGYIFAPFLAFVVGSIAFAIKSVLLETLYFFGLYDIALGPGKFILLYTLMVLITSITISLFTGIALLKESSLDVIPRTI